MPKLGRALPQGILSKKGGRLRFVRLLDVVTLLHNLHVGASKPDEVGFEDSLHTLEMITARLSKVKLLTEPAVIESALWSANLLDERGEFWDVKGRTFDELVKALLQPGEKFDRRYSLITEGTTND